MLDNWMKEDDGSITVRPLVGWEAVPAMGMAVLLRLEFLNPEEEFGKHSGQIQIGITPPQAIELAQLLLRKAEQVLAMKPEGRPS